MILRQADRPVINRIHTDSKSKGYDAALLDSEREAVADLLQYLESKALILLYLQQDQLAGLPVTKGVMERHADRDFVTLPYLTRPDGNELLHWRPAPLTLHPIVQRECRSPAKCRASLCRNHGKVGPGSRMASQTE